MLDHLPGDQPEAVSAFDWDLQVQMVRASGNRVFLLIYNDTRPAFLELGTAYFSSTKTRAASQRYYARLRDALQRSPEAVEQCVADTMTEALELWDAQPAQPDSELLRKGA